MAFGSSRAWAQPPTGRDPATADKLFRQGQERLAAGDYAVACLKLADSYSLDPTLGTLLNLAFCHEKQGRLYTSFVEYRAAEKQALRSEQHERAAFAKKSAEEIETKLPRARVELSGGASAKRIWIGTEPTSGGGPTPASEMEGGAIDPNKPDFAVAPGPQTIVVETTNGEKLTKEVSIPDIAGRVTVLKFTPKPMAATRPLPAAGNTAETPKPPPPVEDHGSGQRLLGGVVGGVGVLGLAAGSYFGIATFSKKDDAASHCDATGCDAQGLSDGDTAHTYATISTILIPISAIAIGVGAYLFFTAGSGSKGAHQTGSGARLVHLTARGAAISF